MSETEIYPVPIAPFVRPSAPSVDVQALKVKHDISRIFIIYTTLVGCAEKTALALDMTIAEVEALALSEGWNEKVKTISLLSKSGKPGDFERAQNRALNFVQTHALRRLIDKQLAYLGTLSPEDVLSQYDGDGNRRFSARVLSDLATSMERTQAMSYNALSDTTKERLSVPAGEQNPASAQGLHAALILALNNAAPVTGEPAKRLVEESVAKVKSIGEAPPDV